MHFKFMVDGIKSVKPKHIHALHQLFAARFVELVIPDENKLGSAMLNKSDMYLRLRRDELACRFFTR